MDLAFCSKCNYWESYGERSHRSGPGARVNVEMIPKPEFCAKCGAPMLYACPGCGAPRRSMDDKFCTKCGKPYK